MHVSSVVQFMPKKMSATALCPDKPTSTGPNQKCILDTFSNPTFTWVMPLKIRIICKNNNEIAKKNDRSKYK